MIVKNVNVKFTFRLSLGIHSAPKEVDITFTRPDHSYDYDAKGGKVGAIYTPPVPEIIEIPARDGVAFVPGKDETPGTVVFNKKFDTAGLWKIELAAGPAEHHEIIYTGLVNVIEHEPKQEIAVYLP